MGSGTKFGVPFHMHRIEDEVSASGEVPSNEQKKRNRQTGGCIS